MRAIETQEVHGRPTCSECTADLQARRGCKKPGFDFDRQLGPVRWYSPMLQSEEDRVMNECPVGHVLRESPQTYDVIQVASHADQASPGEVLSMSPYLRHASRVVASEKARMRELRDRKRQAESQSRSAKEAIHRA